MAEEDKDNDDSKRFPEDSPIPSDVGSMEECVEWVENNLDDVDDAGAYCAHYHEEGPPFHEDSHGLEERKHFVPKELSEKGVEITTQEIDGKERTTIKMPISSTSVDRDKDNFEKGALEDMKGQLENQTVGLFLDHGGEFNEYPVLDMIGGFYDGEIKDNVLFGKAYLETENETVDQLLKKIEEGLPIGWSVGFANSDKSKNDHGGYSIESADLVEVSAVGIPSNPDAVSDFTEDLADRTAMKVKSMFDGMEIKGESDMTDKQDEEEEEEEEEEDQPDADILISDLSNALDANEGAIIAALEDAGIIEGEEESGEPENTLDEDDIREIVREELRNQLSETEDMEDTADTETENEDSEDGKSHDHEAQEPAGKIQTPKSSDTDNETDDEGGIEKNGPDFDPKI